MVQPSEPEIFFVFCAFPKPMKQTLEKIAAMQPAHPEVIAELIQHFRPRKSGYSPEQQAETLIAFLKSYPDLKQGLQIAISELFTHTNQVAAYTQSGIFSSSGFFSEGIDKVFCKVLPPVPVAGDLKTLINQWFSHDSDHQWMNEISIETWIRLLQAIEIFPERDHISPKQSNITQIINSIMALSYRISAMGIEPDFLQKLPE